MDETPFLEFNLLDIKDSTVAELKKFTKEVYNVEELFSSATTLKYTNKIKSIFEEELREPKEDFIKYFIWGIYEGKATQNVVDRFKPIVKKALNQYISELMNDKLKAALETTISSESESAPTKAEEPLTEEDGKKVIITTAMELEAFYLVKSICREIVDPKRISYKDTVSYFGILLDNNSRKWICRLFLDGSKKHIVYPKGDKEVKMSIDTLDDIFKYKDDLLEIVKQLIAIKD